MSIRSAGPARLTISHSLMSKETAVGGNPFLTYAAAGLGSFAAEKPSAMQRPLESTISPMLPVRASGLSLSIDDTAQSGAACGSQSLVPDVPSVLQPDITSTLPMSKQIPAPFFIAESIV